MARDPVIFRVDGTRNSGWESFSRCLIYAAALQRRRRPCHFLSQLEPPTLLAPQLRRGGNEWIDAGFNAGTPDDLDELISEIRRVRPAAVIIDSPNCGPDYLAELVSMGPLVVSIDHMAQHKFPSHLVVNPQLGPLVEDYDYCEGTQLLLGRRHVIIRSHIRRLRQIRAQEPQGPRRVLLAFGDDRNNLTGRAARMLLKTSKAEHIDIIARPQHPKFSEWESLAEAHEDRVTVAAEPADVAMRVSRCKLALCSANSWALEYAVIGVPSIILMQDEANLPNGKALEAEGAARFLGWHEDVTDKHLHSTVSELLSDGLERQAMARCARAFLDGRGPDRFVTALEILLHPSRRADLMEAA